MSSRVPIVSGRGDLTVSAGRLPCRFAPRNDATAIISKKRINIILSVLGGAFVISAIFSIVLWRQSKTWKDVVNTLQEKIVVLELQVDEGETIRNAKAIQSNLVQVAENKYIGEAVVRGTYFANGVKDGAHMCFSPNKESLAVLPESSIVQVFCFKTSNDEEVNKLSQDFFGKSLEEILTNLKMYSAIDTAREATVKISGYEIREFNKGASRTAYTTLLEILEKK